MTDKQSTVSEAIGLKIQIWTRESAKDWTMVVYRIPLNVDFCCSLQHLEIHRVYDNNFHVQRLFLTAIRFVGVGFPAERPWGQQHRPVSYDENRAWSLIWCACQELNPRHPYESRMSTTIFHVNRCKSSGQIRQLHQIKNKMHPNSIRSW